MDNFLIIRLSSLGDIIHTLPAFAALRKGYPAARITWVVEKAGKEILDLVSGIDRIVVRGEKGWIRAIRGGSGTAIDFQGLLKSAVITRLSGARTRVGFSGKNLREPAASVFYTDRLDPFPEDGHVIDKNLKLLSKVGLAAAEYEFPIVLPESLRRSVRDTLAGLGRNPGQKLVLCNVGAAWESKRWAAERWIELIERIRGKGFFHLLLWGNESEKETARRISAETGTPLAPFFSIPEVLAVIKESGLVVSGDTFALQAAAALDVPVLGIFGPTNPKRNGSFRDRDKIARFPMECGPCYKRECATARCMDAVVPADAAALALEMLKEENG